MNELTRGARIPVISLKGLTGFLRSNKSPLAITILFITGIILGTITINKHNEFILIKTAEIFKDYLAVQAGQSLFALFMNSVFKFSIYILMIYILGLCAIGSPLICALPLIRGLGAGLISGYLYSAYALKGIGYCVLIMYPGLLISVFAMIIGCSKGIEMSYDLLRAVTAGQPCVETGLKKYTSRFFVILAVTVAAALTDTVCYALFMRFFNM